MEKKKCCSHIEEHSLKVKTAFCGPDLMFGLGQEWPINYVGPAFPLGNT